MLLGTGSLAGCSAPSSGDAGGSGSAAETADSGSASGNEPRVVATLRSLAQMAVLAGLPPVGVSEDATDLDGLPSDVQVVGTTAHPSLEKIISLEPTLVLLTSELPSQRELEDGLDDARIEWRDVRIGSFDDYASNMEELTDLSGRDDLYQKNVEDVASAIADVESQASDLP